MSARDEISRKRVCSYKLLTIMAVGVRPTLLPLASLSFATVQHRKKSAIFSQDVRADELQQNLHSIYFPSLFFFMSLSVSVYSLLLINSICGWLVTAVHHINGRLSVFSYKL